MRKNKVAKNCLNCEKAIFVILSKINNGGGKYCSRKCRQIHLWKQPDYYKKQSGLLKGRVSPRKGVIITEETKLRMSLGQKNRTPFSQEHRKNMSLANRGENHWKWKKDRNLVKVGDRSLNDPLQKGWRRAVKDRDGWKCRIADNNCAGRLEAHHILPWKEFPELRNGINNGITLCHHHHPRKKEDVEKLSPYFQELVASLN